MMQDDSSKSNVIFGIRGLNIVGINYSIVEIQDFIVQLQRNPFHHGGAVLF